MTRCPVKSGHPVQYIYIQDSLEDVYFVNKTAHTGMKQIHWNEKKLAEVTPLYENGGEPIGRLLHYHPEKEPEIWGMVGGTGMWKRWHLAAFRRMWRDRNPAEAKRVTKLREYHARAKRKRAHAKLEEAGNRLKRLIAQRNQRPDGDTK